MQGRVSVGRRCVGMVRRVLAQRLGPGPDLGLRVHGMGEIIGWRRDVGDLGRSCDCFSLWLYANLPCVIRTGQVAEMLSGLVVTGDTGKAEEMTYENMWDASPNVEHHAYASSSSQESLGVYTHNAAAGSGREDDSDLTYPSGEDSTPPGPTAQSRYTTSYSSELAYALCGVPESNNKQQQQQQHQQAYSASAQGQGGDEILEMHHALAAFTEHPSSGDLSVPYSMGTFVTPEHDDDMPYNMY